ncbi:hypothetical protein ACFQZC_10890 [Streptacidiphilus monticola]
MNALSFAGPQLAPTIPPSALLASLPARPNAPQALDTARSTQPVTRPAV